MEIRIGAGGWEYFNIPKEMGDKLKWYAKIFDVVEVNSTFYEIPPMNLVKSWRRRTPSNFEFTVKCHKLITHENKLELNLQTRRILERMIDICIVLGSRMLILQTPPSIKPSKENLKKMEKIIKILKKSDINAVWEPRGEEWRRIESREMLRNLIKERKIIHCTDISKEKPAKINKTIYTRLFGKGKYNLYQFTDAEIREIYKRIMELMGKAEKAYIITHTKKMYLDAARIKRYFETGRTIKPTRKEGLQAIVEVLSEDAKFPATRKNLIEKQGWKVIVWKENREVKLKEILKRIPEREYKDLIDVLMEIKKLKFKTLIM